MLLQRHLNDTLAMCNQAERYLVALDVWSRTQAVARARELGLLTSDVGNEEAQSPTDEHSYQLR